MKQTTLLKLFATCNIAFIFLQIHQRSLIIKQSFEAQKYDNAYRDLIHQKEQLTNQLYALQNRSSIKEFAQNSLQLENIALSQVHKVPTQESIELLKLARLAPAEHTPIIPAPGAP